MKSFEDRGMRQAVEFKARDRVVWVFPKMKRECPLGTVSLDEENWLVCVGTLVYSGLPPARSVEEFFEDWKAGKVKWAELYGSFAALRSERGRVSVVTDRLGVQPIFVDEQETLSTSFLALVKASAHSRRVNREAMVEKLATGYVIGPETLVEGIERLGGSESGRGLKSVEWTRPPSRGSAFSRPRKKLEEVAEEQNAVLLKSLERVKTFGEEVGAVLALSAGYDSRLLLGACEALGWRVALQTHASRGSVDHDVNYKIVEAIASAKERKLIVVKTNVFWNWDPQEVYGKLAENMLFFDGRNSFNMGALSETYVSGYSLATLAHNGLRLSGLGGEVYRNYYWTVGNRVRFESWTTSRLLYRTALAVLGGRRKWRQIGQHRRRKIERAIGADLRERESQLMLRRYYSEVRMPQCDGANNNAHNQVAYFLAPFMEWAVIKSSYDAVAAVGLGGRLEAEMIRRFDPSLANGPSHYGFPLGQEPLWHLGKSLCKGLVPGRAWDTLTRVRLAVGQAEREEARRMRAILAGDRRMKELKECLQDWLAQCHLEVAFKDYSHTTNVLFLGMLLKEFGDKLR